MSKIGIVGDSSSITGFLSLGMDVFKAEDSETVKKTVRRLAEEEYSIIYITEKASLMAKDVIAKYKDSPLPAVIVIPGITGNMGIGMVEIRESAKRAIGADILFSEE